MKIKCPACSQVLNIPDSAAGKVVKCPCGKQLKAPGGPAGAARPAGGAPQRPASGAPARPAGANPAAKRPAAKRPAPASGAMGGFDAGMLDELTDQDLQPVKSVASPGRVAPKPNRNAGQASLEKHVASADRKAEMLLAGGLAPLPPFLILIAIFNVLGSMFLIGLGLLVFGLVAAFPMVGEDVADEESAGVVVFVVASGFLVTGLLYLVSGIMCFIRGKISWMLVVGSYCFGLIIRLDTILGVVLDGEVDFFIVREAFGLLVGIAVWAWLHGEDVRGYFGSDDMSLGKMAGVNAGFATLAFILWIVPTFLA